MSATLGDFARWSTGGFDAPEAKMIAARDLLERGPAGAALHVERYRDHLRGKGVAPATVNVRISVLRALVRRSGIGWTLSIPNIPRQPYRDTRGLAWGDVQRLRSTSETMVVARPRSRSLATRNAAIIRLLTDLALRRGEVVSLDVSHLDLSGERARLWVAGKGRGGERVPLTLPTPTLAAVRAWLVVRAAALGDGDGPMFVTFRGVGGGRAAGSAVDGGASDAVPWPARVATMTGRRIDGQTVYAVVRSAAAAAGIVEGPGRRQARPHGLRHAGITEALRQHGGDVTAVRRLSRHADVRTLMVYDDNREDVAGVVAEGLAE